MDANFPGLNLSCESNAFQVDADEALMKKVDES